MCVQTFLEGSDAWSEMESRMMPRHSGDVLGPLFLSRGTPSLWKAEVMGLRPRERGGGGGVIAKKLAR